jgi:hypothetical protein
VRRDTADDAPRALMCALAAFALLLFAAAPAFAEPLTPTSPLYSPSAQLVDENGEVTAEYSGTISQESGSESPGYQKHSLKATLKWATKVSGPIDQIEYAASYGPSAIHWQIVELAGGVSDVGENIAAKEAIGCSATFSASTTDGGTMGVFLPLNEPGMPASGGNPATNPDYRVTPPEGIPLADLSSAVESAAEDPRCATGAWNQPEDWLGKAAELPEWAGATGPTDYFPPGGSFTQPTGLSYTCTACAAGETFNVTINDTLRLSSALPSGTPVTPPGSSTPTPQTPAPPISCRPGSKRSCEDERLAQQDLRKQVDPLAFECGLEGISAHSIVAAFIKPKPGATALQGAEGPTGAQLASAAGTACRLLLERIHEDAGIVKDPPAGPVDKLAEPQRSRRAALNPPSCQHDRGGAQSYCERLRSSDVAYVTAVRSGAAIAAALLTTVDRMVRAEQLHDAAAVSLQSAHAARLRAQLLDAAAVEQRAAAAIAAAVAGARLTFSLSAQQVHTALAKGLAQLSVSGISATSLSELAASPLPSSPLDLEQALAD